MRKALTATCLTLWLLIAVAGTADIKPRSPFDYEFLTYVWVLALSAFGGIANFMRKIQEGSVKAFNLVELVGEVVISSLAGLCTFWLTEWASMDKLLAAVMIAISGHMGSRAIFLLEKFVESKTEAKLGK